MKVLTLTFPKQGTTEFLDKLSCFLLRHSELPSMDANESFNTLMLHPRVQSLDDLPRALVDFCTAQGSWSFEELGVSERLKRELFVVQFFSKSKEGFPLKEGLPTNWRRVLSNFYPFQVEVEGRIYETIEHFFQAKKALFSTRPEMAGSFEVGYLGDDAVSSDPFEAKKAGARKAYRLKDAKLHCEMWEEHRIETMCRGLSARLEQDSLFRDVLFSTKSMVLLHFERSGAKSFWGGSLNKVSGEVQGENMLGKLLMEIRDRER